MISNIDLSKEILQQVKGRDAAKNVKWESLYISFYFYFKQQNKGIWNHGRFEPYTTLYHEYDLILCYWCISWKFINSILDRK